MFNKKINLQNKDLISKALKLLSNDFEVIEGEELFGGISNWDKLREFAQNDCEESTSNHL
jgi:hypothetical protein